MRLSLEKIMSTSRPPDPNPSHVSQNIPTSEVGSRKSGGNTGLFFRADKKTQRTCVARHLGLRVVELLGGAGRSAFSSPLTLRRSIPVVPWKGKKKQESSGISVFSPKGRSVQRSRCLPHTLDSIPGTPVPVLRYPKKLPHVAGSVWVGLRVRGA